MERKHKEKQQQTSSKSDEDDDPNDNFNDAFVTQTSVSTTITTANNQADNYIYTTASNCLDPATKHTFAAADIYQQQTIFKNPSRGFSLNYPSQTNRAQFDRNFFFKILPEFDGTAEKLQKFLNVCDLYSKNLSTADQIEFLSIINIKLVGHAYTTMRFSLADNYQQLRAELVQQFKPKKTMAQLYSELSTLKQKNNESIQDFVNRLNICYNALNEITIEDEAQYDRRPTEQLVESVIRRNERLARDAFVYGVKQPLSTAIVSCRFTNLIDATTFALQQEKYLLKSYCNNCKREGHKIEDCFNRSRQTQFANGNPSNNKPSDDNNPSVNKPSTKRCQYCKNFGHNVSECRKLKNKQNTKGSTDNRPMSPKNK